MNDIELQLSQFGEFLLREKLAPQNRAPFFVRWVRWFLQQRVNPQLSLQDRVQAFVEQLRLDPSKEPWQVEQAEQALRLYHVNFKADTAWEYRVVSKDIKLDADHYHARRILEVMRERLRVRNYAYRTEQTYIAWAEQFFTYQESCRRGTWSAGFKIAPEDMRNFIAHLATDRLVAASTQNQALNALLFLAREVLDMELGDLSQGVRARRGKRLPVVMTTEEVRAVLAALEGTQ